MPLFYFHLRSGPRLERDFTGLKLASAEAAYLEACKAIPGLSVDLIHQGHNPGRYSFEIRDAKGYLHWDVPFIEILGGLPASSHPSARR